MESTSQASLLSLHTAASNAAPRSPQNVKIETGQDVSKGPAPILEEQGFPAIGFPRFRKLPTELRIKICEYPWHIAYQRPSKRSHRLLFEHRSTYKGLNQDILRKYRLIKFAEMGSQLDHCAGESHFPIPVHSGRRQARYHLLQHEYHMGSLRRTSTGASQSLFKSPLSRHIVRYY